MLGEALAAPAPENFVQISFMLVNVSFLVAPKFVLAFLKASNAYPLLSGFDRQVDRCLPVNMLSCVLPLTDSFHSGVQR